MGTTERQTAERVSSGDALLEIKNLRKYFPIRTSVFRQVARGRRGKRTDRQRQVPIRATRYVKAVDDVSLEIKGGETLGLVGETGCGKTTLGRCVVRLYKPLTGQILYRGQETEIDLALLSGREFRPLRRHIQMIFQDPYSSLSPRRTVFDIISEPIKANKLASGTELEERVIHLAQIVGLETRYLRRYPHAFSGGQRQRIGIARALATHPSLVVADEPVSALDVSIQAQILNLLGDLQDQFGLSYLFIAHDLSVVKYVSDRVAVMYVGRLVELAPTEEIYINPKHPYAEALLSAVPISDPDVMRERIVLEGEIPDPCNPPQGCYFHPRCPYARQLCREQVPSWEEIEPGHFAACHLAQELDLRGIE